MSNTIIIGVCVTETKYPNYPAWIRDEANGIEILELSWEKQNGDELHYCHGLLLTGGIDIAPCFYDPELSGYPNQPARWNSARDQFELDLFREAQSMKMPVLGICRGLQLINVAMGGSLIVDLEAAGRINHRNMNGIDYLHPVQIEKNSLLATVSGIGEGVVNSAHHQAIERVAEALIVNCFSDDGIVEGIEWKEKQNHSPMLSVQWHPERIANKEINPLSQKIKAWFFEEASKFKH